MVLRIEGPCWTCACFSDVEFKILSVVGDVEVGRISKKWSGLLKEAFTDADNFGITMPMDLDVRMKAVMMGALFLIVSYFYGLKLLRARLHKFIITEVQLLLQDFMFFERQQN